MNTSWLTSRFEEALLYALRLHRCDRRKGTTIPYAAHLLSVCSLVLYDGGNETQAVAALLHDSLEDHPAEVTPAILEQRFGDEVLQIVLACTDTPPDYTGGPKPPWRQRKEAFLTRVGSMTCAARRVSLADKLDNARTMLADLRCMGPAFWKRFNAGQTEQLWYLQALVRTFEQIGTSSYLLEELQLVVHRIVDLSNSI